MQYSIKFKFQFQFSMLLKFNLKCVLPFKNSFACSTVVQLEALSSDKIFISEDSFIFHFIHLVHS
ncbi:hypothetical protein BT96DRAFT_925610 [Gymnopus androsaceus JB14]|uniref:Uncharacterized protein n=1 Tax=Gymnopus androsaceus JB14 TaxID=1447944 RepID=A0A6A4GYF8_9AGAR|nr:hypothetical protein BT96DRAFT_925610 [Gymnopus androsaceus JB14]